MRKYAIALLLLLLCGSLKAQKVNEKWQQSMLEAVKSFPDKGGYYTGRKVTDKFPKNAWQGMNDAFVMTMNDKYPQILPQKAQPSFCSLATYMVMLKAISIWDANHNKISREAWVNLKPYVGFADAINVNGIGESDGEGCWGRGNANGPGNGVLIHELKAGYSITAYRGAKSDKNKETPTERYMTDAEWRCNPIWSKAVPGDMMKIFWNRNETTGSDCGAIIGCNDVATDDQERGHSVIFMGYDKNGNVEYWSSNGPGKRPEENGYGLGHCDKTAIQRVVFTRIIKPENFNNARNMAPTNVNKWLQSLDGHRHGTTKELMVHCGIR